MIDFFTYNGKNVLPEYLPGIPSYGQEGAPGNTGDKGSSIYYSAYCLSDPSDLLEAQKKIKTNSLLSNNSIYSSPSYADYQKDDLILDSEGKFYILKEVNGELKISNVNSAEDSNNVIKKSLFKDFKVKCITGLTKSADRYPYKVKNTLYDKSNDFYHNIARYYKVSPYSYHSPQYREYMYGNYLYFYAIPAGVNSSYHYKFCLTLPNGETFTSHSDSGDAIMFIDNRHLFACSGFYDYKFELPDSEELKFTKIPTDVYNKPKSLREYFGITHAGSTSYSVDVDEADTYVSLVASYYLQEYATAYFEATDITTSKTYRIDLNDIFYTSKNYTIPSSYIVQDNDIIGREDFVRPTTVNIGWDVINLTKQMYTDEGYTLSNDYLMHKKTVDEPTNNLFFRLDNNATLNFNQFNEFAFLESYNPSAYASSQGSSSPTTAEDGRTFLGVFFPMPTDGVYANVRYVEDQNNGFGPGVLSSAMPTTLKYGSDNVLGSLDLLGNYDGVVQDDTDTLTATANNGGCPNKVLRLYFRKLSELVITVTYNALAGGGYPSTVIYIGKPNIHLFQCSTDKNTPPGIYYLNRIIPYKYSDTLSDDFTTMINGDQATVNIDVNSYKSINNTSAVNFIEIGLMSIKDDPSEHKSSEYQGGNISGYEDVRICVTNVTASDSLSDEYDKEIEDREQKEDEEYSDSTITEITNNTPINNTDTSPDESSESSADIDDFDENYFIKGGYIPAPKIYNSIS